MSERKVPPPTQSGVLDMFVAPPRLHSVEHAASTSIGSDRVPSGGGTAQSRAAMLRTPSEAMRTVLVAPVPSLRTVSDERPSLNRAFDSVVKVLATIREPDHGNPWQSKGIENAVGSGVAFQTERGVRILSAAHVIANQTFLQVQRTGVDDPEKYLATIDAVSSDSDLALLSVQDERFWSGLKPIALGRIPSLRSTVLVAGFPVGGQELSVTEGVVSRIESQSYTHSGRRLPAVSVDAAINPGNSGGPAFSTDGELIGIAFQHLAGMTRGEVQVAFQSIGHIIPPPVIQKFLDGVAQFGPENYQGFPCAGIDYQDLTNPYLRKCFKLKDDVSGVLVTQVVRGNTCDGVLQKNDILTHADGKQVANNGTVALETSGGRHSRIDVTTACAMYQCGEKLSLGIIRNGKPQTIEATARPFKPFVPLTQHDRDLNYYVWCGLVFQPLSVEYLETQESCSAYLWFLATTDGLYEEETEATEVVIFARVLSDQVNVGYEDLIQRRIKSVNGKRVKDLKDLVNKIETSIESPLICIETWQDDSIVLPGPSHPDATSANERILNHYRIPKDRFLD